MAIHSYKEYLDYLNDLKKKPSLVKRSFLVLFVLASISAILTASSIYYINTKIIPKKQARNYLETAKHSIVQTAKTLNDVTAIYKVAGAKTQIISAQNESTPSALGFNTTIGDIQKSIEGLESAKKNIEIQKNNVSTVFTPKGLQEINIQAVDFMDSSEKILEKLKSRQSFFKQMQLAVGPNLYLPKLEADSLWGKLSKVQIIDYYQKTADEATSTIEKLANIAPPVEFKSYYDAQGKYLELVRDVSENIVKILNIEDHQDPSLPSQTEKAYQLFLGANFEGKKIINTLDTEKLSFQSAAEISNQLAEVRLKQQSLEIKLNDVVQSGKYNPAGSGDILETILGNFAY